MALPSAYLITTGKTGDFFAALQQAQAPPRFTQKFLESLGFTSTNDRLFISVLKALGFLNDTGDPQQRYYDYLDKSRSGAVMAEALREAYADLFQVNANAQNMTKADVKNKMKTLTQGEHSDQTLNRMAATFQTLAGLADFERVPAAADEVREAHEMPAQREREQSARAGDDESPLNLRGLHYNINIHLPESRDPAVYDALFRSLREHLL
jgi:hypothetical protein